MEILIDSCIFLDIFTNDPNWYKWSSTILFQYAVDHILIINPIIYSEISIRFNNAKDLDIYLEANDFRRDPIPWEAAFLAGKCFMKYKERGGTRLSPLPDFYIGAHAEVTGMTLMTRDVNRYQTYFPTVSLIKP